MLSSALASSWAMERPPGTNSAVIRRAPRGTPAARGQARVTVAMVKTHTAKTHIVNGALTHGALTHGAVTNGAKPGLQKAGRRGAPFPPPAPAGKAAWIPQAQQALTAPINNTSPGAPMMGTANLAASVCGWVAASDPQAIPPKGNSESIQS